MLTIAKLRYTNGRKVWFSNFMSLHIYNNFDDLSAIVADLREGVGDLIDPPQYLYSQPVKSQKSPTIFGLRLMLKVCI